MIHWDEVGRGLEVDSERRADREASVNDADADMRVVGDVACLAARSHGVNP